MSNSPVIKNLTTHVVSVYDEHRNFLADIPPSNVLARYDIDDSEQYEVAGLPVVRKVFKELRGLPEPEEGVYYIVPSLIAQRVRRKDILAPGLLIRGDNGIPKGCIGLVTYADSEDM